MHNFKKLHLTSLSTTPVFLLPFTNYFKELPNFLLPIILFPFFLNPKALFHPSLPTGYAIIKVTYDPKLVLSSKPSSCWATSEAILTVTAWEGRSGTLVPRDGHRGYCWASLVHRAACVQEVLGSNVNRTESEKLVYTEVKNPSKCGLFRLGEHKHYTFKLSWQQKGETLDTQLRTNWSWQGRKGCTWFRHLYVLHTDRLTCRGRGVPGMRPGDAAYMWYYDLTATSVKSY